MRKGEFQTTLIEKTKLLYQFLNSHIASGKSTGKRSGFVLNLLNPKSAGRMGIGATSLALSMYGLIADADDPHVEEMQNLILSKQLPNGSWTISPLLKSNLSLIYTTCFALEALSFSENSNIQKVVDSGVQWLQDRVNSDGGWGLTQKSPSHIHSTSEVLFLFSLYKGRLRSELFFNALNWLLDQRGDSNHWKDENNQPSLFYSALAYRGIMANGNYSDILSNTKEMLYRAFRSAPCKENKSYFIEVGNQHLIESVHCYTQAAIFAALSETHTSRQDSRLFGLANFYINNQKGLGYWVCNEEPSEAPAFLNHYICFGLTNCLSNYRMDGSSERFHEIRELFFSQPYLVIALLILAILGLIYLAVLAPTIVGTSGSLVDFINTYFEQFSGISNFFEIVGIGGIGSIILYLIKRSRGNSQ